MERTEFLNIKSKILKRISITITVLLLILMLFALLYSYYGIAGLFYNGLTTRIFGLDQQQNLSTPLVSEEEKNYIKYTIGFDPASTDRSSLQNRKMAEMSLTPQGAAYLINSLLKDKRMFVNFQMAMTKDSRLELSAIADVELACQMIGENKSAIESTIGKLPENIPVYSILSARYASESSTITAIRIGRMTLPENLYTSINAYVDKGMELFFKNAMDVDLNGFEVEGALVHIKADFPAP